MNNSHFGSMGSLMSENSCNKPNPNTLEDSESLPSISEPTQKILLQSNNNLAPSSLTFPALKFEVLEGDIEIPSPDRSLWDSLFSEHLDGDFMILSPVRNNPPPESSNYNYSSLLGGSPSRGLSPLGPYNQKGKGMSPLQRVFNSPNNEFMQVESLTLPSLASFLEGYERENYAPSSSFDRVASAPALLDCLMAPNSSRFCGSGSEVTDMECASNVPLLQQLEQERQQEKAQHWSQPSQRAQQHSSSSAHNLVVPMYLEPEQEQDSGLQLVHLLLACAESVAKEDYMLARRYIFHLNRIVSPLGDSMQRVASCFTEALSARLTAILNPKPFTAKPFTPFPPDSLEILKIYQILYQACPYIKFAHFTANQAIFEAFETEARVHVIDLDILQGYQWPAFIQALAARSNGPPFLRITGVGSSPESVRETGRCLSELAHSLHVPFEFHPVGEEVENLKPHMFNRRVGEALAVNSVNRLQRVPSNHIGNILSMIRDQAPNIVTIVEQEASHNGPYFLGRFLEALHYYSAIFDSLDATFPPESSQRQKVEQFIFAPEIENIVACEGVERVMRHEKLEKWRKILENKGFRGVPLSSNAVTQSKILLSLYSCDGYRLTEDKGSLLLGWQDRALIAASAWRC